MKNAVSCAKVLCQAEARNGQWDSSPLKAKILVLLQEYLSLRGFQHFVQWKAVTHMPILNCMHDEIDEIPELLDAALGSILEREMKHSHEV